MVVGKMFLVSNMVIQGTISFAVNFRSVTHGRAIFANFWGRPSCRVIVMS